MYHQFNIQHFYVLPTQCIDVCISEQIAIISIYSINWLLFINEAACVYCAVRTESLNTLRFLWFSSFQDQMLRQYLNSTFSYMIQTQVFRPNTALQTWSKFRHNAAFKTQNSVQLLNFCPPYRPLPNALPCLQPTFTGWTSGNCMPGNL